MSTEKSLHKITDTISVYINYMLKPVNFIKTIVQNILLWPLNFVFKKFERHSPANYGSRTANVIVGLVTSFLRKYHDLGDQKIDLPKSGGVIIVANHVSSIDGFAILGASNRVIRALATSSYNHIPGVKQLLELGNCIYVHDKYDENGKLIPSNNNARDEAISAVKNNSVIMIFPFGGYHSPMKPEPALKLGAAKIAKIANEQLLEEGKIPNVRICPVFISGLNPRSYHRPFACFFQKNNIGIIQYPDIMPEEIMSSSPEEISERFKLLISMHVNRDKK